MPMSMPRAGASALATALESSTTYNRQAGRLEVSGDLAFYKEGPTQASKVISATPKRFGGFILEVQSAANRVTFWDSATGATGTKLLEVTTPAVNTPYMLPSPVMPLNGIYMEVASSGTVTANVKREF
jgi:hypothetical protein